MKAMIAVSTAADRFITKHRKVEIRNRFCRALILEDSQIRFDEYLVVLVVT